MMLSNTPYFSFGNDPTPEGWAEIRNAIARLPEAEQEAIRAIVLDLLTELDHGGN